MKCLPVRNGRALIASPLAEGRELKYNLPVIDIFNIASPLAEGRELKFRAMLEEYAISVAPRGGA